MRADSVVGYLFKAETFCREHLTLKVDSTFRQSGVIDSNGRLFDGSDSLNLDGTKVGFSAKEYLMALRSLRHRIDTYIDSAERE